MKLLLTTSFVDKALKYGMSQIIDHNSKNGKKTMHLMENAMRLNSSSNIFYIDMAKIWSNKFDQLADSVDWYKNEYEKLKEENEKLQERLIILTNANNNKDNTDLNKILSDSEEDKSQIYNNEKGKLNETRVINETLDENTIGINSIFNNSSETKRKSVIMKANSKSQMNPVSLTSTEFDQQVKLNRQK